MTNIKPVEKILISQPYPSNPNSPYFRLAEKWDLKLEFKKFIRVERISLNEFRKQNINPLDFGAIIFTSKKAVDIFFGLLQEMRIEMPSDTKYFCVGESTSKYLQKYIVIRKRKLFVGLRTAMDLKTYITKHKKEKYLFPCSNLHRKELPNWMQKNKIKITEAVVYQTVSADLKDLDMPGYDMVCFFSPSGVKSLLENYPGYQQGEQRVAVFGPTTAKEAEAKGLRVDVIAPKPNFPSMTAAINEYLKSIGQSQV